MHLLRATHTLAPLGTGGPDVIRKEAWPFYRTLSGVRLWWELDESKGPKGPYRPDTHSVGLQGRPGKVGIRLPGDREFKLPWHKAVLPQSTR